jgi:hypothetical protein
VPHGIDQQQLAQQLMEAAQADGVELVGPDKLTKSVLAIALEAEMSEHLGYDHHDTAGRNSGNSRNGSRTKPVLTEIGRVEIEIRRDRDASSHTSRTPFERRDLGDADARRRYTSVGTGGAGPGSPIQAQGSDATAIGGQGGNGGDALGSAEDASEYQIVIGGRGGDGGGAILNSSGWTHFQRTLDGARRTWR